MKKIFLLGFFVIAILSACNSSVLSFTEIKNVPNNVQENVNSDLRLQLITDGEKGSYIVFHSSGDVKTDLETQGETLIIKFNETNLDDEAIEQNTYYLTTGPEHEAIDVQVNGESIPFDNAVVR